jgi:hypothetical protein
MYRSIVDLHGILILESRTSASSSLQVSMDLSTCTHPNTLSAYVHMHPNTLPARVLYAPYYIVSPCTPHKLGFFCIRCNSETFTVNPSYYLILSQLHMYQ